VWASQNPSKPCSEMLRGLGVVKTNDIAQALNQTVQVQPLGQSADACGGRRGGSVSPQGAPRR
jgi:hypothetical protein